MVFCKITIIFNLVFAELHLIYTTIFIMLKRKLNINDCSKIVSLFVLMYMDNGTDYHSLHLSTCTATQQKLTSETISDNAECNVKL